MWCPKEKKICIKGFIRINLEQETRCESNIKYIYNNVILRVNVGIIQPNLGTSGGLMGMKVH
jgi:hypothetical protein